MHYGLPVDDVRLRLVPYHYQANGSENFCAGAPETIQTSAPSLGSGFHTGLN